MMKRILIVSFFCLCISFLGNAQGLFVNKAVVEYEVKTNMLKTMGSGQWADALRESMPQFKTGYFHFIFDNNKSIYKFDHWGKPMVPDWYRRGDEENRWYFDHDNQSFTMLKSVFGTNFYVQDSVRNISWKLTNENSIIAGYNCRKAVGIIMDSVYVFAFYTDEIMISGGPNSISGLPGLILGMTIPRLYTSWMATSVNLKVSDPAVITPPKAKKFDTLKSLGAILKDRTKDWVESDDPDSKKWMDQLFWGTLL